MDFGLKKKNKRKCIQATGNYHKRLHFLEQRQSFIQHFKKYELTVYSS